MSIDCPRWDDYNDQIKKGGPDSSFRDMSKKNWKNQKYYFFSSISLSSIQNYLEMSRDNIEILFAQSIGLCEPNLLSSEGLI